MPDKPGALSVATLTAAVEGWTAGTALVSGSSWDAAPGELDEPFILAG